MVLRYSRIVNNETQRARLYQLSKGGEFITVFYNRYTGKRYRKEFKLLANADKYLQREGFAPKPQLPKGQYRLEQRKDAMERMRKWLISRNDFLRLAPIANRSNISMSKLVTWLKQGRHEFTEEDYKSLRECVDYIKGTVKELL